MTIPPSDLDESQCIRGSFDEANSRLRVGAEITGGSLELTISATEDNIAIRNSDNNNELLINPDGSINVTSTVVGSPNVNLHDGTANAITSQVNGAQRALDVGINVAGVQVDPRAIRALTSSDVVTANQGGTWDINNISGTISLPTGASTSALQTSGNTSLSSIDSKIPSNLTVSSTRLLVDGSGVTQPVSGTIAATQSGAWSTGRTWSLLNSTDSVNSVQSGTWNVGLNAGANTIGAISNTSFDATASGSPLTATGSSLNVNITGGASTGSTDEDTYTYGSSSFTPVGGVYQDTSPTLTAGQSGAARLTAYRGIHSNLRDSSGNEIGTSGSPLRIDPTGATTQPISAASLPLPTGAATNAELITINTTLGSPFQVGGSIGNTSFGASQVGTWNINNISGTISLPTGAATESTLSTLNGKVPSGLTVTSTRLLVDGSGVTQPISGSVSISNFPATTAVTQSTSPWVVSGSVTSGGRTNVGTITGTSTFAINADGMGSVFVKVDGTWTGQLNFEATIDGSSWFAVGGVDLNLYDGNEYFSVATGNPSQGPFRIPVAGYAQFRLNPASAITGTANIYLGDQSSSSVIDSILGTVYTKTDLNDGSGNPITSSLGALSVSIYDSAANSLTSTSNALNVQINDSAGNSLIGQQNMAGSLPVVIASDQTPISVDQIRPNANSVTSVAGSASSVQLLASNPYRLGAAIYNDSSADLYLKLGTTASTSSFTVKMAANSYYEVPFSYTGEIDGIWSSATGNARITEIS